MKQALKLLFVLAMVGFAVTVNARPKWISLFNGKDLSGWFVRGEATWSVQDGILVGEGGMGHIYTDATCTDFEVKGKFSYRIKAVGTHIEFWINRKLVMTYDDEEYTSGHFAIQGHNPGMKIESKKLYYRDLLKK